MAWVMLLWWLATTSAFLGLCEEVFGYLDLDWQEYVGQDPRFMRPAEVDLLVGGGGKARRVLEWEPAVDFRQLVRMMVDADISLLHSEYDLI
jgi:GDPmannose 4,6-dehydratase